MRPLIESLFGSRYQKRHWEPTAARDALVLGEGSEGGVPYAGLINPDNPSSGPYGGTSIVWFPIPGGSLIDFGVGTRDIAPDEGILTRPGHRRRIAALRRLLAASGVEAWSKPDPAALGSKVPKTARERFPGFETCSSGTAPNSISVRVPIDPVAARKVVAALARGLTASFRNRVHDGFFVRAESMVRFADLVEARERDPDYSVNPYRSYGGPLAPPSVPWGSVPLAVPSPAAVRWRDRDGRARIRTLSTTSTNSVGNALRVRRAGNTQIFIASHSPILMTFPGACLLEVTKTGITPTRLEDTTHYQITRDILANPEQYWRHLRGDQ
jgi:hypothetical protein